MSGVTVRRAVEDDDLDAINEGSALWFGAEQELRTVGSVPPERGEAVIFVVEPDCFMLRIRTAIQTWWPPCGPSSARRVCPSLSGK